MVKEIKSVKIHYIDYGITGEESTLVLLHGWGQNIEMMKSLGDSFKNTFRIVILDLPGFGQSSVPKEIWTIYDYADFIHDFLETLNIKNPYMIGHSFGGKVALVYASKYSCEKMVLLASPFKKEIVKLSSKTKMLKTLKKVPGLNKLEGFAKKHIGSRDYRNADPIMRQILVEHVNLDVQNDAKKIECPTLIIWGTEDQEVPYERALELEKLIQDSGVVKLEGGTHYAYLEFFHKVVSVLKIFFER